MTDLILAVCLKHNLHPAQAFFFAFHYAEIRRHPRRMRAYFISWCDKVKGELLMDDVPKFVNDWCLDVLAGRTRIPKLVKQKTTGRVK